MQKVINSGFFPSLHFYSFFKHYNEQELMMKSRGKNYKCYKKNQNESNLRDLPVTLHLQTGHSASVKLAL